MSDKTKLKNQINISADELFEIPSIAQEEDIPPYSHDISLESHLSSGRVKKYEGHNRPKRIWESNFSLIMIVGCGIVLAIAFHIVNSIVINKLFVLLFMITFTFLLFSLLSIIKSASSDSKSSEYRDYLTLKLESSSAPSLEKSKEDNTSEKDIIALMLKNNDETTEYFSISKRQAKISYYFSIIACAVGIVILAASIVAACFKHTDVAIITVISGAITEVIAGTVLWVHNKSALQLNHYYKALHENEKFLSAITLAERVSVVRKDDIYCEIIKRQLNFDVDDKG